MAHRPRNRQREGGKNSGTGQWLSSHDTGLSWGWSNSVGAWTEVRGFMLRVVEAGSSRVGMRRKERTGTEGSVVGLYGGADPAGTAGEPVGGLGGGRSWRNWRRRGRCCERQHERLTAARPWSEGQSRLLANRSDRKGQTIVWPVGARLAPPPNSPVQSGGRARADAVGNRADVD